MPFLPSVSRRSGLLITVLLSGALVLQAHAADSAAALPAGGNLSAALINRLVVRGALTKEDAADLLLLAEADAADARAQAAATQAALARAEAAEARLKAMMALQARQAALNAAGAPPMPAARAGALADTDSDSTPAPAPAPVPRPAPRAVRPARPAPTARVAAPAPAPAPSPEPEPEPEPEPAPAAVTPALVRAAPAPSVAANADSANGGGDDVVHVTYVPEVVKQQLREEIKQEVMDQAREENWAQPRTLPDWITRFRLFGDMRIRYEALRFPNGNDATGSFPNFNAINTGAPYDVDRSNPIRPPQLDVDQNRTRLRLRARLGAEMDLAQGFSAGVRLGSGESNSPVSQNQTLGAAGNAQGGNFSKYAVWIDRAFLKYEAGGLPDKDLGISLGRFENPFFATSMVWADDLGFDGAVVQARFPLGEAVTPFLTVGAFPVFNTDLNFASNQYTKFKSRDKWLYGSQLGATWEISPDFSFKVAAAYYLFKNIEGELSTPFLPLNSTEAGDTDSSRPAFAQKGNTYMALRDIISDPQNNNGQIDQFQYFGLATPFHVGVIDARLDFNHFEPFQVSLFAEWAKNRALDPAAVAPKAVNNGGTPTSTLPNGPYLGTGTAWIAGITLGNVALKERWDWNLGLNYRKVGSDALVDGFVDSDFGGGGTNVKGFTFGGSLALSSAVRLGLRWMSSQQVSGPQLKNDTVQVDFNGKF